MIREMKPGDEMTNRGAPGQGVIPIIFGGDSSEREVAAALRLVKEYNAREGVSPIRPIFAKAGGFYAAEWQKTPIITFKCALAGRDADVAFTTKTGAKAEPLSPAVCQFWYAFFSEEDEDTPKEVRAVGALSLDARRALRGGFEWAPIGTVWVIWLKEQLRRFGSG